MSDFATSTDAMLWAEEFVKRVKENPAMAVDEGSMVGWFANAIMAGYDEAARKYEMVNKHDFIMQGIMSMSKKIDIPYDEQIIECGDDS